MPRSSWIEFHVGNSALLVFRLEGERAGRRARHAHAVGLRRRPRRALRAGAGLPARRSSNRSTSTGTARTSPRTSRATAGRSPRPGPRWRDVISRLRARNEWKFFTVLPKAAPALASAWWVVLLLRGALPALFAIAMGVLVGAVQHGDSLGAAARAHRERVRRVAGAQPDPPGGEREPREPDRHVAERPAHARLRRATGHGAPRTPGARARSRDGARLRPRHLGSAARDRARLHRHRTRRHGRRHRAGDRARRLRVVGAARARRRVGVRRTGCSARARCGATATPTRCAKRSATPTTRTASRSIRRPRRSCGCSASRTGRSRSSRRGGAGCSNCSGERRGCASDR